MEEAERLLSYFAKQSLTRKKKQKTWLPRVKRKVLDDWRSDMSAGIPIKLDLPARESDARVGKMCGTNAAGTFVWVSGISALLSEHYVDFLTDRGATMLCSMRGNQLEDIELSEVKAPVNSDEFFLQFTSPLLPPNPHHTKK